LGLSREQRLRNEIEEFLEIIAEQILKFTCKVSRKILKLSQKVISRESSVIFSKIERVFWQDYNRCTVYFSTSPWYRIPEIKIKRLSTQFISQLRIKFDPLEVRPLFW
jgi:hypothetical protein